MEDTSEASKPFDGERPGIPLEEYLLFKVLLLLPKKFEDWSNTNLDSDIEEGEAEIPVEILLKGNNEEEAFEVAEAAVPKDEEEEGADEGFVELSLFDIILLLLFEDEFLDNLFEIPSKPSLKFKEADSGKNEVFLLLYWKADEVSSKIFELLWPPPPMIKSV